MKQTSWQKVGKWYNAITQDKGHYYHEHVVIPNVLRLLHLKPNDTLLDLACGNGVLERAIPKNVNYTGIDISPTLIESAKKQSRSTNHSYLVRDVTKPLTLSSYSHATCILALQNVENIDGVFQNAYTSLTTEGTFVMVINHPCFRIPRQSSWGIDEQSKLQYRRINRYLTPLSIPITAHPGKQKSPVTWSFHYPLSRYISGLVTAGFSIVGMEEWASDKESEGKHGKMENRARAEIPLFLTMIASKN